MARSAHAAGVQAAALLVLSILPVLWE